jgi:hypothetical protein
VKLRWRSGRLTEKQIGDLTTIGIIKDGRFYGIRDKRELDRADTAKLGSGSGGSGDDAVQASPLPSRHSGAGVSSDVEEQPHRRGEWQHRALPPLSAAAAVELGSKADVTTDRVIPTTMTAAELAGERGSDAAVVGSSESEAEAEAEDVGDRRANHAQPQVGDSNNNDDEQHDSLEIADEDADADADSNDDDDDNDDNDESNDGESGPGVDEVKAGATMREEQEEEERESGLLYEIETEEEWKKLTKEQRRRRRMAQLHQFFAEFGHGNVQHQWPKNKRLANWVYEQKQRWRKGLLSEVRTRLVRVCRACRVVSCVCRVLTSSGFVVQAEVQEFEGLKMRKPRPGFGRPPKRRSGSGSGGADIEGADHRETPDVGDLPSGAGTQPALKKRKKRALSVGAGDYDNSDRSRPAKTATAPIASLSPLMSSAAMMGAQRLPPPASILSYLAPLNHLLPPIIFPAAAAASTASPEPRAAPMEAKESGTSN